MCDIHLVESPRLTIALEEQAEYATETEIIGNGGCQVGFDTYKQKREQEVCVRCSKPLALGAIQELGGTCV